jgi:hypothetical protein
MKSHTIQGSSTVNARNEAERYNTEINQQKNQLAFVQKSIY